MKRFDWLQQVSRIHLSDSKTKEKANSKSQRIIIFCLSNKAYFLSACLLVVIGSSADEAALLVDHLSAELTYFLSSNKSYLQMISLWSTH